MDQPTILALWSAPRSLSTVFAKSFAQRRDAVVLHEPYSDCYYFSALRKSNAFGDHEPALNENGQTVEARIYASRDALASRASSAALATDNTPIVFFKEVAYQADPYISDAFLGKIRHSFLIRHPIRTARSLKRRDSNFDEEAFGFEALQRIFDRAAKTNDTRPIVVDADALSAAPETTLTRYCNAFDLAFDHAMLQWEQGHIRSWEPHERASQMSWHETVSTSTCFTPAEARPSLAELGLSATQHSLVSKAEDIYLRLKEWALP